MHRLTFIDLFAGAGGLAESFVWVDYTHLVHIENKYACNTLRTHTAFH